MRDQIERSIALAQSRPWRIGPWLVIVIFGALFMTPLAVQTLQLDHAAGGENRTLAEPLGWADFRRPSRLSRRLESYVADHFGFRSEFVRLNSLLRYHLGVSSNPQVVIGRQGWLFYNHDRMLEQHIGLDAFSPTELTEWAKRMEVIRLWLAERNIALVIMLAPDKPTIYPEMLPQYALQPGVTTRADQIVARLANGAVPLLDPRQAIMSAKAQYPRLYFEGDTHWSHRAAFIAYELLMKELEKTFPALSPSSLHSFDATEQQVASDLVSHLGLQNDIKVRGEVLTRKGPPMPDPAVRMPEPGAAWGWPIKFYRTNQPDKPRALVFGDSFTDYILGPTFLYASLNDPVFTHHNNIMLDYELIEEVRPEVVILVIAERYLQAMPGPPPKS